MAKTHPLSFRVEAEIKEGLEHAAKEDRRSLSSLIEKILAEWLQGHTGGTPSRAPGGSSSKPDTPAKASPSPPSRKAPRAKPLAMSKEAQIRALRERDAG